MKMLDKISRFLSICQKPFNICYFRNVNFTIDFDFLCACDLILSLHDTQLAKRNNCSCPEKQMSGINFVSKATRE